LLPQAHFHARYGEFEATIEIALLALIEGSLPPRALVLGGWLFIAILGNPKSNGINAKNLAPGVGRVSNSSTANAGESGQ
jgi:hypothetical protein